MTGIPLENWLNNLDIWSEIIGYLEISLESDSESEIKDKRRALLGIALLLSHPSKPALDALWQSMTSLEPITHVVNSKVNSPDENILEFLPIHSGGYWRLKHPLLKDKWDCAHEYLARIRHVRVDLGSAREMGLWAMLNNMGLVLPNIQTLSLDFGQVRHLGPWINAIGPLLSPTLTSIAYQHVSPSHVDRIDTLQAALKSRRSLALTSVSYLGFPSASLLDNCLSFDSLKSLKLRDDSTMSSPERYNTDWSVSKVFEGLPKLKELEIDLRMFTLPDFGDGSPREMAFSPSLTNLHVAGDEPDITRFLKTIKFPSLQSLSVTFLQTARLPWRIVCDQIASNFPQLHSLRFCNRGSERIRELWPHHFSSLLSLPIQSFELDGISHCFTEEYINELLCSWETLHTLAIMNDSESKHFSASVLTHISRATHLHHVKLPLSLSLLESVVLNDSVATSHSKIEEFTLTSIENYSLNLQDKIRVVSNLLILFPRLRRLSTGSLSYETYLGELESLIGFLRHMMVAYQC